MTRFRCRALRRSGATDVRVVQAENAEAARERLIAAGLEPLSVEPIGPSLLDGLGKWRAPQWRPVIAMPAGPVAIATGLLASIPVVVAIGAWSLATLAGANADRLAALAAQTGRDRPQLSRAARIDLAAAMSRTTLSDIVRRLSAALPQDASLASISADAKGQLALAIDTPDPDRLRLALAGDPLLASLAEGGQNRTEYGAIRVTLRGPL